jgi:FMN-dependent NADH-azoreductase
MTTLLQIKSSLFPDGGQSGRMADSYVAAWAQAHPGGRVIRRDVAAEPIPHLDAPRFSAFVTAPEARDDAQRAVVAFSDALVAEWRAADIVVLGLPMYNLGVPSTLKAYFDHIARAGETFRYTETGPVGLLTGKKAHVVASRGGLYAGTANDTQTAYIRQFLGFIGVTEVEFVYAEGLAMGEERRAAALGRADVAIHRLAQ